MQGNSAPRKPSSKSWLPFAISLAILLPLVFNRPAFVGGFAANLKNPASRETGADLPLNEGEHRTPGLAPVFPQAPGVYRWHTFYGSSQNDYGTQVAVDASGNIYIAGNSWASWQGDNSADPLHPYSGSRDITIVKLSPGGEYIWHTFYGNASTEDAALGITVDGNGVYVTGYSMAGWLGDDAQTPLHAYTGGSEIFLLKLSHGGAYQWHTFYGSSDQDVGQAMVVDQDGSFYLCGRSLTAWNGPHDAAPLHAHSGGDELFAMKLSTDGVYQWHTFYGSSQNDMGIGATIDASGLYLVGYSFAAWNGDFGAAPKHGYSGGQDILAMKLDKSGGYLWHTFYGSTADDIGERIISDQQSIYIAGGSWNNWLGDGGQAAYHPHSGSQDFVALKLGHTGNFIWHTFYGSSGDDKAYSISIDNQTVYLGGYSSVTWLGDNNTPPTHGYSGAQEITALALDLQGGYQWHTFYGSSLDDTALGIASSNGSIYLSGQAWTSWAGDLEAPPKHAYSGNVDFLMMRLGELQSYVVSGRVIDQGGNPLPNAKITYGPGQSVYTNCAGEFTIYGLVAGDYTLNPYRGGFTFDPSNLPISVAANVNGITLAGSSPYVWAGCDGFYLNNSRFRFGGTNSYYITTRSRIAGDQVPLLSDASLMNLKVVRVWGFDNQPTFDYVLFSQVVQTAAQQGLKLIVTLTNNWSEFGGMDSYLTGHLFHSDFYTDAQVIGSYKQDIAELILSYKDEPAILAWELANEPRCESNLKPASPDCDADTVRVWAQEISQYIKSIDPNHLISVGDEGFLTCTGSACPDEPEYNGGYKMDFLELLNINTVDFGTYHLYPYTQYVQKPVSLDPEQDWGSRWIRIHSDIANSLRKPVLLEEFGLDTAFPSISELFRSQMYALWTDQSCIYNSAWAFWELGSYVPSYNGLYNVDEPYMIFHPSRALTTTLTANRLMDAARNINLCYWPGQKTIQSTQLYMQSNSLEQVQFAVNTTTPELTVTSTWVTGTLATRLYDPNNQVVIERRQPGRPQLGATHFEGDSLEIYTISNPMLGAWRLELDGASLPTRQQVVVEVKTKLLQHQLYLPMLKR